MKNMFAYGHDGEFFYCAMNYPGSWSDGFLTAHYLQRIKKRIGDYIILCVDKGFPRSGLAFNILVRPYKNCTE